MMYCKYCGESLVAHAKFCKYCGRNTSKTPKQQQIHINHPQDRATPKITEQQNYGTFWPRAGAYMIDLLLVFVALVIFYVVFWDFGESLESIIWLIFFLGYHILFLGIYSATPGKLLFGLKVIDEITLEDIKFSKAFGRAFSYLLSSLLLGIGFLKIAFDKNTHKALHDDIAKTIVIQKKHNNTLAVILAIISTLVYLYILGIYSEEIEEPYTIREGTREIRNQLNLNEDLFKEAKTVGNEEGEIGTTPKEKLSFDVNQELSAVVEIICPDDNEERDSAGSGTLITDTGLILTNYHVIENSNLYYCEIGITNDITKPPEYIYYATDIITGDEGDYSVINKELDVAIIQIVEAVEGYHLPSEYPAVSQLGSSDILNINDKVFVAGYPSYGGNTITYTEGVVSGRLGDDLIKTSAKIDFGNSGGAVFNEIGEYIGMPTLIFEGGLEGLGYIVGIDSVLDWILESSD